MKAPKHPVKFLLYQLGRLQAYLMAKRLNKVFKGMNRQQRRQTMRTLKKEALKKYNKKLK